MHTALVRYLRGVSHWLLENYSTITLVLYDRYLTHPHTLFWMQLTPQRGFVQYLLQIRRSWHTTPEFTRSSPLRWRFCWPSATNRNGAWTILDSWVGSSLRRGKRLDRLWASDKFVDKTRIPTLNVMWLRTTTCRPCSPGSLTWRSQRSCCTLWLVHFPKFLKDPPFCESVHVRTCSWVVDLQLRWPLG